MGQCENETINYLYDYTAPARMVLIKHNFFHHILRHLVLLQQFRDTAPS